MARLALLLALLGAPSAHAGEAPLLEDRHGYAQAPLPHRILVDVVALPAGAPWWTPTGWALFGAVGGATAGLMLPLDPSLDVHFDRRVSAALNPRIPDVWTVPMQAVLWPTLGLGTAGAWGAAHLWDWPAVAEAASLITEAVAVSQVYHLSFKLLLGREGPEDGDGLGLLHGPPGFFRLFPAGTPSGHAATLWAFLGVVEGYAQPPWPVSVATHGGLGVLIALHVLERKHFLSDSLWGSAMGYAIGRWVVRHRSTRGDGGAAGGLHLALTPHPHGLALLGAW